MIYTTNAIESLHMQLRKIVKNRGHFPNGQTATKLRFLALLNIEKNWIAYRRLECLKIKTALSDFELKLPLLENNTVAVSADRMKCRVQRAEVASNVNEAIISAQGMKGK